MSVKLSSQERFLVCLTKLCVANTQLTPAQQSALEGLVLATYSLFIRSQPGLLASVLPPSLFDQDGEGLRSKKNTRLPPNGSASISTQTSANLSSVQSATGDALLNKTVTASGTGSHSGAALFDTASTFDYNRQYTFGYDFNFGKTGSNTKSNSWIGSFFNTTALMDMCNCFSSLSKDASKNKSLSADITSSSTATNMFT